MKRYKNNIKKFNYFFLFFIIVSFGLLSAHAQNNPPVAVNDTATTFSGIEVTINPRSNDSDPDGGLFLIDTVMDDVINGAFTYTPFQIYYTPDLNFVGVDTITYVICDNGTPSLCDTAIVTINVLDKMYAPYQFLDINNIKAMFNASGSHFWDANGTTDARFEVPKGSGRHTMFVADIWIGGLNNDSLHLAAQRYRNNGFGEDFWAGPIMDSVQYSSTHDSIWNHMWKVNKCDIDSHIAYWNQPGYVALQVIIDWPAHGDVSLGQAYNLAPFFDRTGDNIYDPYDGDYPLIKGDQAIYIIRNDDRDVHAESGGAKLRIEIHEMAYAFNCPADSALWNTIFINYRIINRSNNTYDSTYIGFYGDMDIGLYNDDYIGCDVERGSFFGYNSTQNGTAYGAHPPSQSITFLKGPLMDADGLDNPKGGCDASVNGVGFGDGITDNEHWGMTSFISNCNPVVGPCSSPQGDPETALDYYNYMKAIWKDGTKLTYGGSGEETNFLFPGISDSCHWGTGGIPPLDTVPWTDQGAGNGERGIGSTGPFTFFPGDTAEMDLALVFGRDYVDTINSHLASVEVMKERIDSIRAYFENNLTPCGGTPCSFSFTGISESQRKFDNIIVYPNPFSDYTTIEAFVPEEVRNTEIVIYNLLGIIVKRYPLEKGVNTITVSADDLTGGIYFYVLMADERMLDKGKMAVIK